MGRKPSVNRKMTFQLSKFFHRASVTSFLFTYALQKKAGCDGVGPHVGKCSNALHFIQISTVETGVL